MVIQTDDQPLEEFHGRWTDLWGRNRPIMPNTQRMIRDRGIEFRQYVTPFPLCAPSRASLLSGQYAQNHGVVRIVGPRGGWDGYRSNPIRNENLAVWLQRAGYRTSHFGKFINHYGGPDAPAEAEVPPGWDQWVSDATDNSTREFYGYRQNVNGQITPRMGDPSYDLLGGRDPLGCPTLGLAQCNYHSDSMSVQAAREIRGNPGRRPLYLQLDFHTPHGDSRPPIGPEPATRHYDTAAQTPGPTPGGYNEADVSDKPWFLRYDLPRLSSNEVTQLGIEYQKSVEALRSVDEGVARVIAALRDTGRLKNTYVIFTSDNGFFLGQHRIHRGKLLPYEPALRVPFVIRGPGIRPGTTSRELVANQDIAPTLLRLARTQGSGYRIDGRSMVPFWKKPGRISRRPILLESYQAGTHLIPGDYPDEPLSLFGPGGAIPRRAQVSAKAPNENYVGIRVGPYKYIRYEAEGEGELYVLPKDPYELKNRFGEPGYERIERYMSRQLARLRGCAGAACRAPAPPWPTHPRN